MLDELQLGIIRDEANALANDPFSPIYRAMGTTLLALLGEHSVFKGALVQLRDVYTCDGICHQVAELALENKSYQDEEDKIG